MPTVRVDLLDTKVTQTQRRELAESLTKVVCETLCDPRETVTVVFKSVSKMEVARGGKLGG